MVPITRLEFIVPSRQLGGFSTAIQDPVRKNGRTVFKPPTEVVQMLFLPPIIIG